MDILTQSPLTFAHGWEAITAPARTINPHTAAVTEAWLNYSNWIDRRGNVSEELYFTTREELYKLAKEAEARAEAWNRQECTCTPVSDPCPACVELLRKQHGDTIPYTELQPIWATCPSCNGEGMIEVMGNHSTYSTQYNVHMETCDRCNGYGKIEA